jgi:hypothetical protein
MISYAIMLTMCTLTVNSPESLTIDKCVVIPQIYEVKNEGGRSVMTDRMCKAEMNRLAQKINGPVRAELQTRTDFPYTKRIAKEGICVPLQDA